MFGFENNSQDNSVNDNNTGFTGRVDGEYGFKADHSQPIYTDAHYVPASENTAPPRFYAPPEKPVREPKVKKPGGHKMLKMVALCLVFALLGGIVGAAVPTISMSRRIDSLESALKGLEQDHEVLSTVQSESAAQTATAPSGGKVFVGIPAAQVYEQACRQVVGISSEITYTNFFGMSSSSAVSGSGFIVSEDGYILTNYHVVQQAISNNADVDVILHDGTRYTASIVGTEADNDVAVLKIDAEGLSAATLGDSDGMNVGDVIYAVGNPLGELEFSMSTGHVSALDRLISTEANTAPINMFQIDAAVNSGNSGGPIYDGDGHVIGIVTAKYSSSGVEGLGFAIPINDAAAIANDLITKGYVTGKAFMGVQLDNRYNSMYSQYYGMPIGAYVASVDAGSCAEKAGIQTGDIITKLGEYEITGYNDLKTAVKQFSAGETTQLTLYRAGESLIVDITFDEAVPDSVS